MAGYSGTPLPAKLGIKAGARVAMIDAPAHLPEILVPLPDDVTLTRGLRGTTPFDVILLFTDRQKALLDRFRPASARLTAPGGLWVAWPKKSSGVATDLTENLVRDIGLAAGLVDNKVCAIDDTWSGLRFVRRVKDRPR